MDLKPYRCIFCTILLTDFVPQWRHKWNGVQYNLLCATTMKKLTSDCCKGTANCTCLAAWAVMLWLTHLMRPKLKHAELRRSRESSREGPDPLLAASPLCSAGWSAQPWAQKCSWQWWGAVFSPQCHQGTIYIQHCLVSAGSPAGKCKQGCNKSSPLLLMNKPLTGTQLLRSNYSQKFPLCWLWRGME